MQNTKKCVKTHKFSYSILFNFNSLYNCRIFIVITFLLSKNIVVFAFGTAHSHNVVCASVSHCCYNNVRCYDVATDWENMLSTPVILFEIRGNAPLIQGNGRSRQIALSNERAHDPNSN